MRKTIHAYYDDFAGYVEVIGPELHSPTVWDAPRSSDARFFFLSEHKQDWVAFFADRVDLRERAEAIAALYWEQGLKHVFSFGAGVGALEYFIKTDNRDLHLTCTDYAPIH